MTDSIRFPKAGLGFFPTPLAELSKLSKRLGGPRILMKRDDLTGLAFGGNKVRKLEFLIGDALASGCDTVVTGGAAQSNHCRQTAAAAAAYGLACHLALGGEALYPHEIPTGNLLLDLLFAAEIHWCGTFRKGERIPEIMEQIRSRGGRPYLIPYGGSNATGALGFVEAVGELVRQLELSTLASAEVTHLVFASSSGGTHAGLMVGKARYGLSAKLIGIAIDKDAETEGAFRERIRSLADETAALLGMTCRFFPAEIDLETGYTGGGYGVVGDLERKAIRLLAETEGILLDPVYTGRAMGALIDMIERGRFSSGDTVLFWHTGGTPSLFPYAGDVLEA
jgi:D-cysteine desulfhydrase